jgi:rare lipoprotein A (peptidoglycan hydrolase)
VLTPAPPANQGAETAKSDSNTAAAESTSAPAPASTGFEELYKQQTGNSKRLNNEKGPGSWFKSNASPGKYYALHNSAPRGTIIKVTNPLNGRSVYAKVLESIPQVKQNAGLIIKLSDSALEALGTNETRFYCELSYDK